MQIRKNGVVAIGAALCTTLALGGTAYAATTHAATTHAATTTKHATTKHHPKRSLLARADHATFEVKRDGAWVTLDYDRGKVSAVSDTSITLLRPDGQSVTEAINSSTKFTGVSSASQIVTGHRARVISENGTALRVAQRPLAAAS